jgi:hypothetical protein
MFPARYWPKAYWPGRYWPPAASAAPPTPAALVVTLRLACGHDPELVLPCAYPDAVRLAMSYEAQMDLAAAYQNVVPLRMGVLDMPPEQLIRIIRAQDLSLRFTMDRPRSVSGWSVTFAVKKKLGGTQVISRTVGSGVTLTDTGRGVITVSLAKADTSSLTLTTALSDGEGYVWNLKRTDSGSNVVLARGEFILEEEVTA